MIRKVKFKHVFSPANNIFSHMPEISYLTDLELSQSQLDILLFTTCTSRLLAPVTEYYLTYNPEPEITDSQLTSLSDMIYKYFNRRWQSLYDTYELSYDPIHNYYDEHTGTDKDNEEIDLQKERNYNNYKEKETHTYEETKTPTGTIVEKYDPSTGNYQKQVTDTALKADNESTTENALYGFNSSNPVPSDESITKNSSKNTNIEEHSGYIRNETTYENNYKETLKHDESQLGQGREKTFTGSHSDTNTGTDNHEKIYNSIHKGNIGNLTTQQLLREELEFRKNLFVKDIINDVKEFLTLNIYC